MSCAGFEPALPRSYDYHIGQQPQRGVLTTILTGPEFHLPWMKYDPLYIAVELTYVMPVTTGVVWPLLPTGPVGCQSYNRSLDNVSLASPVDSARNHRSCWVARGLATLTAVDQSEVFSPILHSAFIPSSPRSSTFKTGIKQAIQTSGFGSPRISSLPKAEYTTVEPPCLRIYVAPIAKLGD